METCSESRRNAESPSDVPMVHTRHLDTVWFQVAGTVCNLRCSHCFISCSPENDKFSFLSLDTCRSYLEEAKALDTKEYYFTGGEPFANPRMCDILELALQYEPATVLTNAILLPATIVARLSSIRDQADHDLEIRVSLDGYSPKTNDPIRGQGTFDKAMNGVQKLVQVGFRPIITITRTWDGPDDCILARFSDVMAGVGYNDARLKVLPSIKLGAEVRRSGEYCSEARVTQEMMRGYDESRLLCRTSRVVTNRGVWVCPILLDFDEARVGETLAESSGDYPLSHAACYTCWKHGAICSNETGCTAPQNPADTPLSCSN